MMWNRNEAFRTLDALRREVESAFEEFDGGRTPRWRGAFLPGVSARAYPLLNLSEDSDNIYVEALAPGLNPDAIEVSVLRDTLRIAGEKTPINESIKSDAFHRSERGAGRFVRTLSLPAEVEADNVQASYTNGLLLLTLPKSETAKPKQITVNVG